MAKVSEEEEKDLAVMKQKMQDEKLACYDYLKYLDRDNLEGLASSGYRNMTNAEAMRMAFKSSQRRLEKLEKDFLKKYPDE